MMDSEQFACDITNLDRAALLWIMDHTYGNIYVSGPDGEILFVNHHVEDVFHIPREQLLSMNTKDLSGSGLINRSTTLEAMREKRTVIGSYQSKFGKEYFAISTPMLDENGEIRLVMTYSQERTTYDQFYEAIQQERALTESYKSMLNFLTASAKAGRSVIIESPVMKQLYSRTAHIAKTDSTVFIYGESGIGKDVMATYIHEVSNRSAQVFLTVNCASIQPNLIESELFGYVGGAYTGASRHGKPGLFELANGGTLFLDEIGELPIDSQAKLLRVIETGEFSRVGDGGKNAMRTDVRIIAATNRNIKQMVSQGRFREDLYYRLNVIPIKIPPLRERREDIVPLANYFLSELNRKYSMERSFSPELLSMLQDYPWPGNVRELRNLVEYLVITSVDSVIRKDQRIMELLNCESVREPAETEAGQAPATPSGSVRKQYTDMERRRVLDALVQANGNKTKAAQLLGISKGKLYRLMKKL